MTWWKESFEKINSELELIKQKRNALENLLNSGRISQTTYEYYSKELAELEEEIENRRKALVEKMNAKISHLENQLQVLEMLFTEIEISHAVGKMDEETYNRQRDALSTGLEFARQELNALKDTLSSIEPFKAEVEAPAEQQILTEGAVEETVQVPTEPQEEEKVEEQVTVETVETVEPVEVTPEETQPPIETEETPVEEIPTEEINVQTVEAETEGAVETTEGAVEETVEA
ncbi:CdvA-like protein [Candidatus Bathyarchaeota archaeon]|nr:CdvA-like protein [Candidatus Bathyarchaeota archaeon]